MNRIDKKFSELKQKNKSAFIAYSTAGYPDMAATEKLLKEFSRRGVDIVELGIPFSDPLADGPLIQNASARALKKGATLSRIFSLVKRVRRTVHMPICFMTYYNPVFTMGEGKFIQMCVECGVDGVIIPDLPAEESAGFSRVCKRNAINVISFISPTTTDIRMKRICRAARGFVYYVSLAGVTGPRQRLPYDIRRQVERIKAVTSTPVCVGFGVSSQEQVKSLSRFCDGVIVGSAIVRQINCYAGKPGMTEGVGRFVGRLAQGTERQRR
jgi:tryptophan synthase alpha chain